VRAVRIWQAWAAGARVAAVYLIVLTTPAAAQVQPAAPPSEQATADSVRNELRTILRQYPPAVADVLRLSPSLASDGDYLRAYPALAAFLTSHAEIVQNPAFYFGAGRTAWDWEEQTGGTRRARVVSGMLDSVAVFTGLMMVLGVIAWLLKSLIDHRRWSRAIKVQADAHAKLLERLSSTDDLLAYSQTPAGRHFLESGGPIETPGHGVSAPLNRILWSMQMGMVIGVLGLGVLVSAERVAKDPDLLEVGRFLSIMATVGISIGAGFLLSALAAYLLSRRLGLIVPPEPPRG